MLESDQPEEQSKNRNLKWPLSILAIVILLLVIAGFGIYHYRNAPPPTYTYSKLDQYKLAGPKPGMGMTFNKPQELTKLTSQQDQVELEHLQTLATGKKKMVSYIGAASAVDAQKITQDQLDALNKEVTSTSSFKQSSYSLNSLNTFLKDRLPEGWSIVLSHSSSFTDPYIKNNAWSFSLKSVDPKTKQELDGKVVYAISQDSHYYYFMVIAQPADWQVNSKTWDTVFSSLKIDQ